MAANDRDIEEALAASLQQQEDDQLRAALLLSQMSTHPVSEDDLTRALRESRNAEAQRKLLQEELMLSAAAELDLRQTIEEDDILAQLSQFHDQQEEEDEEDDEEIVYVSNPQLYRPAVMDQQQRDVTEEDEDELLRRAMLLSMQPTLAAPQQGGGSSSRSNVEQQYPVAAAAAVVVPIPAPALVMTPLRDAVSKREQLEIKVASIFLRLKEEVRFKPDCDDSAVKFVLENLIKANGDKEINGVNLLAAFDARKKVDNPNMQKKLYEPLRAALASLAEKEKAKPVSSLQHQQH